jgi:hypothetical protein
LKTELFVFYFLKIIIINCSVVNFLKNRPQTADFFVIFM